MGLITDLGVDGGGIYHPQHKNRWALTFVNLGNGTDAQALRLQAITADRPKLGFEKITLDRYNTRAFIAGKYTWETVSVTFESDMGGKVVEAIQQQLEKQQQIIGPGSAPGLPVTPIGHNYKFQLIQQMLDGDGVINAVEQWVLSGCYFENVDYSDLDYSASETVKVVCVISFDHAQQDIFPGRGGFAS